MMKKLSNLLLLALLIGQAPLSAADRPVEPAPAPPAAETPAGPIDDGGDEDALVNFALSHPAGETYNPAAYNEAAIAQATADATAATAATAARLAAFEAALDDDAELSEKQAALLAKVQARQAKDSTDNAFGAWAESTTTHQSEIDGITGKVFNPYKNKHGWDAVKRQLEGDISARKAEAEAEAIRQLRNDAAVKRLHGPMMKAWSGRDKEAFAKKRAAIAAAHAAAAGATDYSVAHPGGAGYNPAQHNAGHEVDPDYPAKPNHWYNWFGNNKLATGGIATGGVAAIGSTTIMSVAFHNRGKTDEQIAAMHPLARWMTTAGLRTAKAMGMNWGRKVGDLQEMAEEAATKMAPAVDMNMDMGDVDPFSMDEANAAA